jgi:hypothetical protein
VQIYPSEQNLDVRDSGLFLRCFFTNFGWTHSTDNIKLYVFHCSITTQVYERFDASSVGESDDARFDYFCTRVSHFVLVLHLHNAL